MSGTIHLHLAEFCLEEKISHCEIHLSPLIVLTRVFHARITSIPNNVTAFYPITGEAP